MSPKPIDARAVQRAAARRLATSLRPRTVFLSACDGDVDGLVAAFSEWCTHHAGAVCDLALSARWVQAVVPPPAAGSLNPNDLRLYAERQLAHYFSDSRAQVGTDWLLSVSDDVRVPLVLATPRSLVTALREVAARRRVRVRRVMPWWLRACSSLKGGSIRIKALEPELGTTISFADGRLSRVAVDPDHGSTASHASVAQADDEHVVRLWPDVHPIPPVCDDDAVASVIRSGFPRRELPGLDLWKPSIRPWRVSWVALLAAAAVAVASEHRRDEALDRRTDAQAALIRLQSQSSRPMRRHSERVAAGTGDAYPIAADAVTLQAALDMLALRNHAWASVFTGVEAASPGTTMLELQHDAGRPEVDVSVLVPGDDAAWTLAERLASDSSRFSQATLVTSERLGPPNAGLTSRVHVRALLKADLLGLGGRTP